MEDDNQKTEWRRLVEMCSNLPEGSPKFKATQGLLDIFIESGETEDPLDMDAICKKTDLNREELDRLWQAYDAMSDEEVYEEMDLDDDEPLYFRVPDSDKAFEMTDWPKPKDDDTYLLSHDLDGSAFFTLGDIEAVQKQFVQLADKKYARELKKYGLIDCIETPFLETFGTGYDFPMINTFFWILYHKGKEWVPVRSYAIEMLKWTPFFTLENFEEPEKFIKAFSKFTSELLCTRGICSLAKENSDEEIKKGMYAIKGTEAFYSLLTVVSLVILLHQGQLYKRKGCCFLFLFFPLLLFLSGYSF